MSTIYSKTIKTILFAINFVIDIVISLSPIQLSHYEHACLITLEGKFRWVNDSPVYGLGGGSSTKFTSHKITVIYTSIHIFCSISICNLNMLKMFTELNNKKLMSCSLETLMKFRSAM